MKTNDVRMAQWLKEIEANPGIKAMIQNGRDAGKAVYAVLSARRVVRGNWPSIVRCKGIGESVRAIMGVASGEGDMGCHPHRGVEMRL